MGKKYYTTDHEWIDVDGGTGTIGISDYAQEQLGDVVFVELPDVGTVIEVNEDLENAPDLINESAEEDGWFLKIDIGDEDELSDLMSEKEYGKYLETLS